MVTEPQRPAPGDGNSEKEGTDGEGQNGNPPFIVFRRRLYILAKNPPPLNHRMGKAEEVVPKPRARRYQSGQKGRPAAVVGRGRARVQAKRVRPYVKGPFRVYSSRFPHLAPVRDRRKGRRLIPRTLE